MSEIEKESTGGGAAGFQIPLGVKKRKTKVDELLSLNSDINEGHALAYFMTLDESAGEEVGKKLESCEFNEVADQVRMHNLRELIRMKVREIVRKKSGGGGYTLYSPNPKKKGKAKPVGTFPTKLGAKRAELARFPPKDSDKLKRLRKAVDKMSKDPEKRAAAEKSAAAAKGTDKPHTKTPTKESVGLNEETPLHGDINGFMSGLKTLPKTGAERGKYVTSHMGHAPFVKSLQGHPQGKQLHQQLMGFLNSPKNAGPGGTTKTTVGSDTTSSMSNALSPEKLERKQASERVDLMHRSILAKIIKERILRSATGLNEALFREERSGSEWDELIAKLSTKATTGDRKFQNLQNNIEKKTEAVLNSAMGAIKKALGKSVKLKSFGTKKDEKKGKTYVAFSADMDGVAIEPVYVYVESGVPKIEVSEQAKIALTKAEPGTAKLFRAELVTVQERVLDKEESLIDAVASRDKYLAKLEGEVDKYIAGLTPLQVSLMKSLLVKKYRKLS